MKTNNLQRKSFLMTILALTAGMFASKAGSGMKVKGGGELHANPIYSHRTKKFKGYMRENRRCTFNKNK